MTCTCGRGLDGRFCLGCGYAPVGCNCIPAEAESVRPSAPTNPFAGPLSDAPLDPPSSLSAVAAQLHTSPELAPILDLVEATLNRFVVFVNVHQAAAMTLWVAHTHTVEAVDTTPYMHVASAEKRSGKTRLLEVLEQLVPEPVRGASMSPAVLFRLLDEKRRTLLLDEVDTIFAPKSDREELRGLLDAGFSRGTPAWRIVTRGMTHTPTPYDAFSAKVLAGIGNLPDTIEDRSVPILLKRRRRGDNIERFRRRVVLAELHQVRGRLEAWATEHTASLAGAWPDLPEELNDRAQDIWEPLLALADVAGSDWPSRARDAAVALHTDREDSSDSYAVLLLEHVRRAFLESGIDTMTTPDLLRVLFTYEEGPWAGWWLDARGEVLPKAAGKLSRVLNRYRDPIPKQNVIKLHDGSTARGYRLEWFEDAFERYLPLMVQTPVTDVEGVTPQVVPTSSVTSDTPVTPVFTEGVEDAGAPEGALEAVDEPGWVRLQREAGEVPVPPTPEAEAAALALVAATFDATEVEPSPSAVEAAPGSRDWYASLAANPVADADDLPLLGGDAE